MKKWLFMLTLVSPVLFASTCALSVRDAALKGLGAYVADFVNFVLTTFVPIPA
jgi:hypothetical protein